MPIKVQGPDGSEHEFPDGTADAVIDRAMKAYVQVAQPAAPQQGPTDDSRARGFGLGVLKPVENASKALMMVPGMKAADEWMARNMGTTPYDQITAERDAARQNNSRTGYQMAGNAAGLLPTAAIPGGPALQGAVGGALLTDETTIGGVAKDAGIGAVAGKVGDVVIGGAARIAKPYISKGAAALKDAGVPMTFGQLVSEATEKSGAVGRTIGRTVKGIEDRVSGLPGVGDVVNTARERGTVAYNTAVLNRALAPIKKQLPPDIPPGHDAVKFVGDQLSDGYNTLLPKMSATVDRPFVKGLADTWDDVATLPDAKQTQFTNIMESVFANRAKPGMKFDGDGLKSAESRLTEIIDNYKTSANGDDRTLAAALDTVRGHFRDLIERGNPNYAGELKALNRGWRELSIAEKAAAAQGSTQGIFTPKQYAAAARAADSSVRKRATARGTMPNQELTDAAARILPNTVPDSGTTGRAAVVGAGLGAIGMVSPTTAGAMLASALPYTNVGQKMTNSLFVGDRSTQARLLAKLLDESRRYAPAVVTPALPYATE